MRNDFSTYRHAALVAAVAGLLSVGATRVDAAGTDPLRARQWSHDHVHVTEAWRLSTGRGAVVALLDSGVDLRHPDLRRNLLVLPGADVADPDGCLDSKCRDDGPRDIDGHGTATAGMVGAVAGNGIGMAGIAPDARLMPVRVNSSAGLSFRALARGIRFAADHGADVIAVWVAAPELPYAASSRGLSGESANDQPAGSVAEVYAAVEYAWSRGALLIASAGNGWPSPSLVSPSAPQGGLGKPECGVPAVHPKVLCVGAVDRDDQHAYYSDFRVLDPEMLVVGPSGRDVSGGALPSGMSPCADRIVATYPITATRACAGDLPAGYTYLSGTTSGAAHVAGIAALLAGQGRSNVEILDILRSTSVDLGPPGTDPVYGRGRVDALAAVRAP